MLQHEIRKSKGIVKKSKRLGRGNSSGKGNYSARGIKGQLSRSGGGMPAWFEGGQTPLSMRLPKLRGFKRYYKLVKKYQIVNLKDLQIKDAIKDGQEVTKELLKEVGLIKKENALVKILGDATNFKKKLVFVGIDAFSDSAKKIIEELGGEIK